MENSPVAEITLGALLHDIGKVVRRSKIGEGPKKHTIEGDEFLKKVGFFNLSVYALKHHDVEGEYNTFLHLIHYADMLSAMEREEITEKVWDELVCLKSPIPSIDVLYPPKMITEDVVFPIDECDPEEVKRLYKSIIDFLQKNLSSLKRPPHPDTVLNILEKSLFFVSSETNIGDGRKPDISLYAHLKSTAMLASSLYLFMIHKGIKAPSPDDIKSVLENEKPFLLLKGDFSGIQNFIYNITSKGALKSLRARSLFIEILTNVVVREILDRLGLYRTNVIHSGGGGFTLLLPNTDVAKKTIEDIRKDLNEWLFKNDHNILMVMEYGEFGKAELENGELYLEFYSKLTRNLNERKLHPYDLEELRKIFKDRKEGVAQCSICGKRLDEIHHELEDGSPICEFCHDMLIFGKEVSNGEFLVESPNGVEIFNRGFEVVESEEDVVFETGSLIFDLKGLGRGNSYNLPSGIYLGQRDFESLANEALGGEYLAVFRADVDSLGRLFRNLGKQNAFSKVTTFSSMLTLFFKNYVPRICEGVYKSFKYLRKFDKSNVVIVYSGGDDLFIVGAWNDVVAVAFDIRNAFKKFTGGLTLSGGVVFMKPKGELFKIAKLSGMAEDEAKSFKDDGIEKNAVAFNLGEVEVDSWDKAEKTFNAFLGSIFNEDGKPVVSRSFIRKMMSLVGEAKKGEKLYIPKYLYHLVRNVKDQNLREKLENLHAFFIDKVAITVLKIADLMVRR